MEWDGDPRTPARVTLDFPAGEPFRDLVGEFDHNLQVVGDALQLRVTRRGSLVVVAGPDAAVSTGADVLEQLYEVALLGQELDEATVDQSCRMLRADPEVRLAELFRDSVSVGIGKKRVHPRSIRQRAYMHAIAENDLTFGLGPAGTGKTFLAMALGLSALLDDEVRRIVLCRPAVEAGEKLGFLPGDMAEKVNPYLRPLFDALQDLVGFDKSQRLMAKGVIEVAPLAFMRGRTLSDSFCILDEAQNTTPAQMKMFLTRIGTGSKVVVTGDVSQVDLPANQGSGLVHVLKVLRGVRGIGKVTFTDADVVRHPLVSAIIRAYDRHDSSSAAGQHHPGDPPWRD